MPRYLPEAISLSACFAWARARSSVRLITKCIWGSYFLSRARYIWVRSREETFLRRTSSPSSRTVEKAISFRSLGTSLEAMAGAALRWSGLRRAVAGGGGGGVWPGGRGSEKKGRGAGVGIVGARRCYTGCWLL